MRQMWLRFRRHWVRHLLTIVQVSLGIAAVVAVFSDVLPVLQTFQVRERQNDVLLVEYGTGQGYRRSAFSLDDVEYVMQEGDAVEAAAVVNPFYSPRIRVGERYYAVRGGARVTASLADVADLEMVDGSFFTQADAERDRPAVAVISEVLARYLFGDERAVGKRITLEMDERFPDSEPGTDLTIVGVFTTGSEDRIGGSMVFPTTGPTDLLIPVATGDNRISTFIQMYVRAREGMAAQAEGELTALLSERVKARVGQGPGDTPESAEVMVRPVELGNAAYSRGMLQGAVIMGTMGLIALIVGGIAIFTTQLVSISERTRAIGMQRALGATRARIVRESLAESAALAAAGGVLGAVMAYPLGRYVLAPILSNYGRSGIPLGHLLIAGVLGVLLAVAIGVGAGLYPAWTAARLEPARAFRGEDA